MALVVPPVTDLARRSRAAQGGTQEPQSMFPTLVAVRNDRVVAMVTSPRIGATLTGATTMAVGLDPQALVLAAQATIEGRPVIAYSVMTRERTAKFVVQPIQVDGEQIHFAQPVDGGEPQDPTILQALAEALAQRPIDVTTVARRDRSGTFGVDPFLPAEEGRVVVDAGTVSTLHERVEGIAGQALYVARSREAGRLALQAGLPRVCLLQPDAPESGGGGGDGSEAGGDGRPKGSAG